MRNCFLILGALVLLGLPVDSDASLLANWDFTSATPLTDTTGNGNDLSNPGSSVTFNSLTGANFNNSTATRLELPYNAALEPGAITPGSRWELSLKGVNSDMTSGFGAVYSSRDANGRGTVVYRASNDRWQFWTGNNSGGWNIVSHNVAIEESKNYDLRATWDGTTMGFFVDDGSSTWFGSASPGAVGFQTGTRPQAFGSGGNNVGEFAFVGSVQSASIAIIPEPSTTLLLGVLATVAGFTRRKRRLARA